MQERVSLFRFMQKVETKDKTIEIRLKKLNGPFSQSACVSLRNNQITSGVTWNRLSRLETKAK